MQEPRHRAENRIERLGVAAEIAADKTRLLADPAELVQHERQGSILRAVIELEFGPGALALFGGHEMAIAGSEDDGISRLNSHRRLRLIGKLRPAPAVEHDVIGDDVLEIRHHICADRPHGRRFGNPGRACIDVEIDGPRQPDGPQNI